MGINSKSYQNFRGVNGISVEPQVITFTTRGADAATTAGLKAPAIVSMQPANGATNVPTTLMQLSVTFDQPMGGGMSWTGGGPSFPEGTGQPQWSADKKTCTMPVKLKPNWSYELGINSMSHNNFQSERGVPLTPVLWRFSTGN